MKKPNFDNLLPLFGSKEEFCLTEKQYKQHTGAELPKDTSYLKRKSALSRVAKEYGYSIAVNERTICLKRQIS